MSKNLSPTKTVAAIHDLSGFGRCALTVIIPTLSVMGAQVIPMPTAILSSHTGGFSGFSFLDLTDEMEHFSAHWQKLGLTFNSIYSGFLGSAAQIKTVSEFIDTFGKDSDIVMVDPVMGDDGKLYSTITEEIKNGMLSLVKKADIITPNITEACLLLGLPHPEGHLESREEIYGMLRALSDLGPAMTVMTGIHLSEKKIATASYDAKSGVYDLHICERLNKNYPGTGDIFSSVLLGRLLEGEKLASASAEASEFVREVIYDTSLYATPEREGVLLEKNLAKLAADFKK